MNNELRLTALLVLSEVGIQILQQRKLQRKVDLQSAAAKIQNTAIGLKELKIHMNTDALVSDWIKRFFRHEAVNRVSASIFHNLCLSPLPHHSPPMLPSVSQLPFPPSPSSPASPCRTGLSPPLTSPPYKSTSPPSQQQKSNLCHSC